MDPIEEYQQLTRRHFLTSAAGGIGGTALASMLGSDFSNPMAPKLSQFAPKAKNCIFFFMAGAPSQLDLFDPKPKLNELDGKKMDGSLLEGKRFAFIKKESAVLMGSNRKFTQHGNSGMWFSDLVPNIATCADDLCMVRSLHTDQFNHHPGQLLMQTGEANFGRPAIGS